MKSFTVESQDVAKCSSTAGDGLLLFVTRILYQATRSCSRRANV